MSLRLERILTKLALQHAEYLLHQQDLSEDRTRKLATGLSRHGILVIVGDVDERYKAQKDTLFTEWVRVFGDLYQSLTHAVFPSMTEISAVYADEIHPPIIVIKAKATAVVDVIAGYAVPYIMQRQEETRLSEPEMRGVITYMLNDLEAHDLPRDKWEDACQRSMTTLAKLVQHPVKQISLTTFKRPIFRDIKTQTMRVDEPTPPPDLPEMPASLPTATRDLFSSPIPIFFDKRKKKGNTGALPPIPRPPKKDG